MKTLNKLLISTMALSTIFTASSILPAHAESNTTLPNQEISQDQTRNVVGEVTNLAPGQSFTITNKGFREAIFSVDPYHSPNAVFMEILNNDRLVFSTTLLNATGPYSHLLLNTDPNATYSLRVTNLANTTLRVASTIRATK